MTIAQVLTVVGSINLDLVARVERAPGPGETVADGVLTREPGGKGANQAIAAARLGATVRMVGAVGGDAEGRSMIASLAEAGVDVTDIQITDAASGTALIVVDRTGENSIVVCPGANAGIDPSAIEMPPHGALLAQLEVSADVVARAASLTDGFFALNASPARDLPEDLFDRVDLFIVNQSEYERMPRLASARLVALTLGAEGAVLLRQGVETARAAGVPTAVRSTVGAGDAFAAALTLGFTAGEDPATALRRSCAVGAAAVADERSQPLLRPLAEYLA
ncbi:ribokinase [Microbacterium immunditiarum]|uniref:Ribokinase n=1 Tax=Microbacterium immunditiarum TaxID=337480 RepID=A0A7Y9GMZ2_9MICO|nr:ribokinase [Microbacterium immunditiarum]NYE19377.1 ribokinase [Microbacterium immunditiarum]